MTDKLDWKKDLKELYTPPAKAPVIVDVPAMNFLMIDGHGDPNGSDLYQASLEALYALSYTLKFAIKKAGGPEYAVFPPEGLWWVQAGEEFRLDDKRNWYWTMMIAQPAAVTPDWVERARAEAIKKKGSPLLEQVYFEHFAEGRAAQIMHLGPYAAEAPTIDRLHAFIEEQGCHLRGKHHEIYLSDVRRTAPDKLKTIIRQPVTP